MPFDEPNIPDTISPYRSSKRSFGEYAQDAISIWLIEQLQDKYPQHKTVNGFADIHYSYFSDLNPDDPKVGLKLPAVAIDVTTSEHGTIGSAIGDGNGGVVAGRLSDCQINVVIITQTASMAASIEARVGTKLDRIVNFEESPLLFLTKFHMADDRGFRATYSFDFPALFQNLSEKNFMKVSFYRSGFAEDFMEESDDIWNGIVGGQSYDITSDDQSKTTKLISHVSLGVKFTPNIS